MSIGQFRQGESGRTDIKALHVQSGLDRNGIDFNKELLNQGKSLELDLAGFFISAFKAMHHQVMGLTRRHVGQDRDDTGAAQRTQRHDLVIVSGINIDLTVHKLSELCHLADVAGSFLDGCDIGLIPDQFCDSLRQDVRAGPGGDIVNDTGQFCRRGDRPEMFVEAILCSFIIVGSDEKQTVRAAFFGFLRHHDCVSCVIGACSGDHRNAAFCHFNCITDRFEVFIILECGSFPARTADDQGICPLADLIFDQPFQRIIIDLFVSMHGCDEGDT